MKKKILIGSVIVGVILLIVGFPYISSGFFNRVKDDGYVYISKQDTYEKVIEKLKPFADNKNALDKWASLRGYKEHIKSGKYKVSKGMTYFTLINKLRSGAQEEIHLTFNNVETLNQLAGKISKKINVDSAQLVQYVTSDKFLQQNGLNKENVKQIFIPNTYNFYWDTSKEEFVSKMKAEYDKFWTEDRIEKAKKEGLTPSEAIVLASIVQKESSKTDDQPKVARLYLNRLHQDMKLQSDPTVIYAIKMRDGFDIVIKRLYEKQLFIDSKYNTYKYKGLPPAPITIVEPQVIDAVLNAPDNDYIYMCASVDNWGYHEFASDLETHEKNRAKYVAWLNENQKKQE